MNGYNENDLYRSGYDHNNMHHRNDVMTNWSNNKNDNTSEKREKERPVHPIWNHLQLLEDEIQRMYSSKHDFIEAPSSAYTEAYFRGIPFSAVKITFQIFNLFLLSMLVMFLMSYFEIEEYIRISAVFLMFFVFFAYPLFVLARIKQWVSGGKYTSRFYSHVKGITNLVFILELIFIFLLIFITFFTNQQNLVNFMIEYTPEMIQNSSYFNLENFYFALVQLYEYAIIVFFLSLFFYVFAVRRSTALQKVNTILIYKEVNTNSNVAEMIMDAKEDF